MKIGDKVWRFDSNRRVYSRDDNGKALGGPIYAEHFYEATITGETSRSWIVSGRYHFDTIKVNKKTLEGIYTDQQKADDIWANEHRHKIVGLVQRCDVEDLRRVAEVLSYCPEESEAK